MTVEYAKARLAESKAVIETTFDSGLSSPGRLHDLFVSVEAVTPGEFKTRGAGIEIAYGFHATPFGQCLLGATEHGICWLSFVDGHNDREALRDLQERWSGARLTHGPGDTAPLADSAFSGLSKRSRASLSLLLMGTNFQIQVWQALLRIPPGAVVSYGMLGERIRSRAASRAIGSAVGDNPIAYLIPCHRVIRQTGLLGGYRWGEPRKRAMLAWEAARTASAV